MRSSNKYCYKSIANNSTTRVFLGRILIILCLFPWLVGCEQPQQPTQHYQVGIINIVPNLNPVVEGFKEGMTKLGYTENSNISYHAPTVSRDRSNLEQAIREVEQQGADLILTVTSEITVGAQALTDTPIIFAPAMDPLKAGIVNSLDHPGKNATGVQTGVVCGKALEWLQNAVPGIKRVFVPHHPKNHGSKVCLKDLKQGANKLGITLLVDAIESKTELANSLRNIPEDADAIWLLNSTFLVPHIKLYVEAAIKNKLPLGSAASQYKSGVLISYGHKHKFTGIQASQLAHKVLSGQDPSNLPVVTANLFLALNLKTAKAIGVEIPTSILRQAKDIVH